MSYRRFKAPNLAALLCALVMVCQAGSVIAQGAASKQAAQPALIPLVEGMAYQVIEPAKGPRASIGQFVEFEASLKDPDGKAITGPWFGRQTLVLARIQRNYPAMARMLLHSPPGERRRWSLSHKHAPPGSPPGVYQLELKVMGYPDLLKAPDTLNSPPPEAKTTRSGLRYLVLKQGKGGPKPTANSTITIDYSGWDTQGRMFDSSLERPKPATLPLNALILGWQEGLPLMSPGDTFRFWIPGPLAYDSLPRPDPKGPLVFDVTLLGFSP